jgi:hypothetical protein
LPGTLTKPYKERLARDAAKNAYYWLTGDNVSCKTLCLFIYLVSSSVITGKRSKDQPNEIQDNV